MKHKEDLLASLRAVFGDWEDLLAYKTESEINAKGRVGGWSIKDVIAHLMAWQQISISASGDMPFLPYWRVPSSITVSISKRCPPNQNSGSA